MSGPCHGQEVRYLVHLRRGGVVRARSVDWMPRRLRAVVEVTRAAHDDHAGESRRVVERVEVRHYPDAAVAYVEDLAAPEATHRHLAAVKRSST